MEPYIGPSSRTGTGRNRRGNECMRVLLAYPPGSTGFSSPPTGLAALQASLRDHYVEPVVVSDLNTQWFQFLSTHWEDVRPAFASRFRRQSLDALPSGGRS